MAIGEKPTPALDADLQRYLERHGRTDRNQNNRTSCLTCNCPEKYITGTGIPSCRLGKRPNSCQKN